MKRVLIMAGGTGGHVFPALAIAKVLKEQGVEIEWLGTKLGIESKLVPPAGYKLHYLSVSGVRGKSFFKKLWAPFKILNALRQARAIIRAYQPDAVIGLGGFASGPGGAAAILAHIPLFIHEQNAVAGTTNRILAYKARLIFESFPGTFAPKFKAILSGNPIRTEILSLPTPDERFKNRTGSIRILVVGGSLGAQILNQTVPESLHLLPKGMFEVWHQTGDAGFNATEETYRHYSIPAKITPFIQEMAESYAWADLVICRSGALTVSELAAIGLPSILIPFPYAIDDHQTKNAEFLSAHNAAILLPQSQLTPASLSELLQSLARETLLTMAQHAYRLRKVDATEMICREILFLF